MELKLLAGEQWKIEKEEIKLLSKEISSFSFPNASPTLQAKWFCTA